METLKQTIIEILKKYEGKESILDMAKRISKAIDYLNYEIIYSVMGKNLGKGSEIISSEIIKQLSPAPEHSMRPIGVNKDSETCTIELDKKGFISLVNGTSPNYDAMEHPLVKGKGSYNGSHDRWDWHSYELEKLNTEELYQLYSICVNSWKR